MKSSTHAARIAALMALAAGLLGWLAGHTDVLFADGLRYVDQARNLDAGDLRAGLARAVDHPAYPLAVAAAHRRLGGEGPASWQRAGQVASVLAGVLLVVPLYLVAAELFGPASAWLGTLLVYLTPQTGHTLADVLSEGTFLLFWTWGLYFALRFLRDGRSSWLPPTIAGAALAYLARPEGLLLPGALVASLGLMPLVRSTRLNWPRWWLAVGVLVVGPALVVGPYVASKGGLGTKPAVSRLLGTAPKSAADAVERLRPLEPGQTTSRTYMLACRAVLGALRDAVGTPLLPLSVLGLIGAWRVGGRPREWLLIGVVLAASGLALVRLHATGGYCTPRHALIPATILLMAAGSGLDRLLRSIAVPGRWVGLGEGRFQVGPAAWGAAILGVAAWSAPTALTHVNASFLGYRQAGDYLAGAAGPGGKVVDVTGWSLFYGRREGYTFADLVSAPDDPGVRFVVAREAHLAGPWWYSAKLRELTRGLTPEKVFPEVADPARSKVLVYRIPERVAAAPAGPTR